MLVNDFFISNFLFVIFIFLGGYSIVRVGFIGFFSNKFCVQIFFIVYVIFINCFICMSIYHWSLFLLILILSFLSLFLILTGYGISFESCVIIFFKLIGDFFIILYLGFYFFIVKKCEVICFKSFIILYNDIFMFLLISFFVYSLCGVFGFWIYWAMDGSYFTSSYLHSVGFIMIGLILFFKIYFFGFFNSHLDLIFVIFNLFLITFIFFITCFVITRKSKKAFGYYSCSSVSFIFLFFIISPFLGFCYFFYSSLIKVIFFEIMGYGFKNFVRKKDSLDYFFFIKFKYRFGYLSFLIFNLFFLIPTFLVSFFFYFYLRSDLVLDVFYSFLIFKSLKYLFYLKIIGLSGFIIKQIFFIFNEDRRIFLEMFNFLFRKFFWLKSIWFFVFLSICYVVFFLFRIFGSIFIFIYVLDFLMWWFLFFFLFFNYSKILKFLNLEVKTRSILKILIFFRNNYLFNDFLDVYLLIHGYWSISKCFTNNLFILISSIFVFLLSFIL